MGVLCGLAGLTKPAMLLLAVNDYADVYDHEASQTGCPIPRQHPFRAFLHERRALGAKGRNWLFFGERSAKTDYLYREELEAMRADGHLRRLDTAFSRDQENKLYVQDRMIEHGSKFWSWLEDGASVYGCGNASRTAKDVHAALHSNFYVSCTPSSTPSLGDW